MSENFLILITCIYDTMDSLFNYVVRIWSSFGVDFSTIVILSVLVFAIFGLVKPLISSGSGASDKAKKTDNSKNSKGG